MKINEPIIDGQLEMVPLFLHIPKTAGTTLSNYIYSEYKSAVYYKAEGGFLCDGIYYYPAGLHKEPELSVAPNIQGALGRDDVRAVVGHFSFGIHEYLARQTTYITLLRNPVERVLSLYHHIRKYDDTELHERLVSEDISIEDFVLKLGCKETDNDQTRRIAGIDPEFGRCTTAILNTAKDNLERNFLFGTTDRFDETLTLISRALNWTSNVKLQPGLVNPSRPKIDSLPHKTIDTILMCNEFDMQLYEFAQKLLDAQLSARA
jgi:hypothetical protein